MDRLIGSQKQKVFVIVEYYLPGYKAGGAIRSVANLVDCLSDQFDFWILTRDRDAADKVAYADVKTDAWNQVGKAKVFYASPRSLSRSNILRLANDVKPAIYYLNSFFSYLTIKLLLSRRLGMLSKSPVILAPRGEFSPGALRLKKIKKTLYIGIASRLGLYDDVWWQVASSQEEAEVCAGWGQQIKFHIAPDLPQLGSDFKYAMAAPLSKDAGHVRFAFLSRITRKKNLAWALKRLRGLSGQVEFDVYGPPEDRDYWRECEQRIAELPKNIRVKYYGPIPNHEARSTLQNYHFFFFPTLGESFGHAIFDALAVGCPVIVSNTTPWQDLSPKGAGWSLPLGVEEVWERVLQECVDMDEEVYSSMSLQAREYAINFIANGGILQLNRNLFLSVLNGTG
jgi:glycosyltransferase involved in cell wall biosynthesis